MSNKCEIVLSEPVAHVIESQVASGRYADFSAAIQDAAWHFFVASPSPFEEYQVTPKEVARSAAKDRARIAQARKKGTLKPWE